LEPYSWWRRHAFQRTQFLICRMADTLERPEERNTRIDVGGPDVLSFRQIALLAAQAAGVKNLRCTNLSGHARQHALQLA
jgi:uncharacterized protein YbjT (DUF2867 family)